MRVKNDKLSVTMKAGEALAAGDVVYLSAAKEVKKATTTEAAKVIGVARDAASSGADVEVIIYGIATVVADAAIAIGDRVIAAAVAGRVNVENTNAVSISDPGHTHTENTAAAYTQNATTASATTGVTGTYEHGRIVGKALGSAAAAGDALDILVCLS